MKKIIVTTTINPPTEALLKYSLLKDQLTNFTKLFTEEKESKEN